MNKTLLVAKHEFLATAANRAFVIITLIGPLLILALTVLPSVLATRGQTSAGSTLAVVGADEPTLAALAAALAPAKAIVASAADEGTARSGIASGRYAAALLLPGLWTEARTLTLLAKTGTDYAFYSRIEAVAAALSRDARAAASGIDPALVRRLLAGPGFDVVVPGKEAKGSGGGLDQYLGILFTVLAFVMLMYMTVLLYGQLIGRSVILEKSSKTVEFMLSSVSSRDLLAGKILGPGLAGLIQYAFWVAIALAGIGVLGPALHVSLPSTLTAGNLFWLVAFFVPAYFLYSSIYAALGAGAEDDQHLTQLALPLLVFLMLPLVLLNFFLSSPNSAISVICSFFPLTSPIVMLIRVLVSPPAWWQLALSYAILLASVWGAYRLAAKVFRVGILMTGKRRRLSEILRWASLK
jgi:ABC-2 type transport system permease protein